MKLADFITQNREAILLEWEDFARTCTPASKGMDVPALRDHASKMLTVIAKDLGTPQDEWEKAEKSKGNAPDNGTDVPTAAEDHGADRAESGFSVEQMISEYRALRASVIRLWTKAEGHKLLPGDVEDLTRFNEAIDQSLAESIQRYSEDLHTSKEMFLAILGHDLRTPIGAILTSAQFMLDTGELNETQSTLTSRVGSSATRMLGMVGDLLDFTRSRLGNGIPVLRAPMDMGVLMHDVAGEIEAAHPNRAVTVRTNGDLAGEWDAARVSQAFVNLIGNALEHGDPTAPVIVTVSGSGDDVSIVIHNAGTPISPHLLRGLFNPMKVRETSARPLSNGRTGNLGLGLYIAERIVYAHQGSITVRSTADEGTTFTMTLPRLEKDVLGLKVAAAPV